MLEPISENKATTLQTKLSGTERAMKVLDQIKLQFPNITDEEISDLVTKIKAKRSVEENIVKNDNESNIPN
ncbi:MAG: hypothetical protein H6772_00995 [Pseudomonadales bacterium]|nr:hypothetical protein [Pseudomonadales bacterium]